MLERPYKNLEDFRRKHFFWRPNAANDPIKWPCLLCNSRGWDYDPDDPPDPIEGNKMRRHLACPACEKSGCGPREAVVKAYREAITAWKRRKDEHNQLVKIRKTALKKLSKEEITALRLLGV